MNLVLIGFMGTGKTAVGRELAKRLGREFVDLDHLLEERAGRTIPQIFTQDGEAAFRTMERQLIQEVSARDGLVLAAGGGAVTDPENIQRLKAHGVVVCLSATPDVLAKRLGAGAAKRPLLAGGPILDRIQSLLASRQAAYAQANHTVDTSSLTVGEVVEVILQTVPQAARKTGS
ncbi:MAG: shikimate kinase [Candidatus Omnitrophica bacterium]|nr:shikimate kinase [Candidatus Omnitrophota bacterium]